MNYLKLLEDGFRNIQEYESSKMSRLEYLGDEIFGFITYDSEMSELFARKAIEVARAITERTTFEYIDSAFRDSDTDISNYSWFLLMLNFDFFKDRTNWGTSIRGAWWDMGRKPNVFESSGLYDGDDQVLKLVFAEKEEWMEFVKAILDFAAPELEALEKNS